MSLKTCLSLHLHWRQHKLLEIRLQKMHSSMYRVTDSQHLLQFNLYGQSTEIRVSDRPSTVSGEEANLILQSHEIRLHQYLYWL